MIITHSGFARSLLLAVQREPYRPNNAELVPVIVDKVGRRGDALGDTLDADSDEWDGDGAEVVAAHAAGAGANGVDRSAGASQQAAAMAGRPLRGAISLDKVAPS